MMILPRLSGAHRSRKGWWRVNCPFCLSRVGKEDSRSSLGVRDAESYYHCFRCSAHGFVRGDELRAIAARGAGEPKRGSEPPGPPPGFFPFVGNEGSASLREALDYVTRPVGEKGRGLSAALISQAGIGACVRGKYGGRVVVPIRDEEGVWIGFSARDWTGQAHLKYLYPSWMERGSLLYNARALHDLSRAPRPVFAVEGVFDALALWPDAVAFLGTPSEDQIDALLEARRPICVLLDGDAHRKGWGLAMRLRLEGRYAGAVTLPPTRDPDEVPREDLERAAQWAIDSAGAESVL
jgi:DNA primase